MNLNPKMLRSASRYFMAGLLIFEGAIAIIYLSSIWVTGQPYHPFDMDGRMTIPSLLQAGLILAVGAIAFSLFLWRGKSAEPPSRPFLIAIAIFALYAGLDEIFKLHLGFRNLVPIVGTKYWIGIYMSLLSLFFVIFYRDLKALWRFYRPQTGLGLVALTIFVLGAFGGEIFKYVLFHPILNLLFPNRHFVAFFAEKVRVVVEEGLELVGETLFLYAILLLVAKRIENQRLKQEERERTD